MFINQFLNRLCLVCVSHRPSATKSKLYTAFLFTVRRRVSKSEKWETGPAFKIKISVLLSKIKCYKMLFYKAIMHVNTTNNTVVHFRHGRQVQRHNIIYDIKHKSISHCLIWSLHISVCFYKEPPVTLPWAVVKFCTCMIPVFDWIWETSFQFFCCLCLDLSPISTEMVWTCFT